MFQILSKNKEQKKGTKDEVQTYKPHFLTNKGWLHTSNYDGITVVLEGPFILHKIILLFYLNIKGIIKKETVYEVVENPGSFPTPLDIIK